MLGTLYNSIPSFPHSTAPLPAAAPRKVHLWCIFFALLAMNGPFHNTFKRENK